MSAPIASPGAKARSRALLVGIAVAIACAGATFAQIWIDYHDTRERAQTTASDIAKVVETHMITSVAQASNTIDLVGAMVLEDGGPEALRYGSGWRRLSAYCKGLVGCGSIAVVNPAGRVVAVSDEAGDPDIDASDRAYYQAARTQRELFIGPAVIARIAGQPVLFPVARAIRDNAGQLQAVVTVGMEAEQVARFYALMGFSAAPTVTVFTGNADLVARHPDMRRHVGKNNASDPLFRTELQRGSSGTYEAVSLFDGKRRIAAFRKIDQLNLVVFAGIELPVAYEAWRQRTMTTIGIASAALVLVALLLHFGYRALSREQVLARSNVRLDQLSHVDTLTGIANRRSFDAALARDWARHERESGALAILMIDVDHFKLYNDHYGHPAGDACLHAVAQALSNALHREVDLVARYGGEEFAAIVESDLAGAVQVAQRLRAAVQALAIAHAMSPTAATVTISIGVAASPACGADSAATLVAAADDALYAAKRGGRNQVHPAPDRL